MWVQDRFGDGRQVAERTLADGRKVAERTLSDGGKVAGRTWLDGRKIVERAYNEGLQVAGRTYLDGRREAEQRFEEGRHLVTHRLDDGRRAVGESRRMIRDRFGERAPAVEAGVVAGAVIWSALIVAAGASIAYFCWNQYRRGRAENAGRFLDEHGGAGPRIPTPEMVMAHNTAPKAQGHEAVDPSDDDLVEPAEALFLHAPLDDAPPEGAGVLKSRPAGLTNEAHGLAAAATAAQASRPDALESSLAVQGAASASKRKGPNGATPAAASPRRKGPTVM